MSEFKGKSRRVRCLDCTKFTGSHCAIKSAKVSSKKRRLCDLYIFKGEYENRTPPPVVRVPHVDRKTERLLKRLRKLGVVTPSGPARGTAPAAFVPTSTATSGSIERQKDE